MTTSTRRRPECIRARRDAGEELEDALLDAWVSGVLDYLDLAPDGRELDGAQRARATRALGTAGAAIARAGRDRGLLRGSAAEMPLDATLLLLRLMQRGLRLALSPDPAQRARAAAAGTVAGHAELLEADWQDYIAARREAARARLGAAEGGAR